MIDGNEIWEALFGILKGDVPDELTDDVLSQLAETLNLAHRRGGEVVAWMYYAEDGQEATAPLKNQLVPNTMGWTETPLYAAPPTDEVARLRDIVERLATQFYPTMAEATKAAQIALGDTP